MDAHDLVSLPERMLELVQRRWRHLLVGVGVVALVNVVLLELLLHSPFGSPPSSGIPSFGSIALTVTIGYLVVIAYASLPMAVATSALTEGDDDTPASFLVPTVPAALRQWSRLAIMLSPFLLLALWAVHSIFSALSNAFESALSGAKPDMPLAIDLIGLLAKAPISWVLAVVVVGAWCMYAAVDALDIQRGYVPTHLVTLVRLHPLAVGVLSVLSAVVLGTPLRKALKGSLESLVPTFGDKPEAAGIVSVVVLAVVCSAFISAVAVAWVSLYGGEWHDAPAVEDEDADAPVSPQPPAPEQAPMPQPNVIDLPQQLAQPGVTLGWWAFVPEGASVGIATWVGAGVQPRIAVANQTGAWANTTQAPDGTHAFTSPAAAWYYLAVASQEPAPQQMHVRLILPPGAQLQQQSAAA